MTTPKQKFPIGKIILCAVIYTVIASIIHTVGAMITMSYYLDEKYFKVWSTFMMPVAGPPPLSFTLLSLFFSLINALIFVVFYVIFKDSIPGKKLYQKGLIYGIIIALLVGITYFLTTFLLINLPIGLLVYWFFESTIIYLLGGLITAKIIK